jgi:hypothetical protein
VPAREPEPAGDDELRVRFPEHDFDGYWFFGGLHGDGPYEAIVFGLSLGVNDGYDWGFRDVVPDTDFCLYRFELVGRDRSVGFLEQGIHRHAFRYSHRRLHIELSELVRFDGTWPQLSCVMRSRDGQSSLEMTGTMGLTHWSPDMVLRGTSWVTVMSPNVHFEGVLTHEGERVRFSGVGALDHPMGRLFKSPSTAGMGFWEYNCLMLNDEFGMFAWHIVDRQGDIVLSEAVTDFPDGRYHTGALSLAYREFAAGDGVPVPQRWTCTVDADHGRLEYEVRVAGPQIAPSAIRRGQPLPNYLLDVAGTFTPLEGDPVEIRGKGTGESVISERNPQTGSAQLPW